MQFVFVVTNTAALNMTQSNSAQFLRGPNIFSIVMAGFFVFIQKCVPVDMHILSLLLSRVIYMCIL